MSIIQVPGLNVDSRDGAMMTALMWAAFHGKPSHIKLLLEKGADPALGDVDGMTAVHWSVQRHDTRALQVRIDCMKEERPITFCTFLLNFQVLINQESAQYSTNKGKTAMHQSAEQARTCMYLKLLIEGLDTWN